MAVWIDVTDPANWTAQRIVYDDPTPDSCIPASYAEDSTDVWTWDGSQWVLPTLTITTNSRWAKVPTLRYVGAIDSSTISGIRLTGNMVGNHTVSGSGLLCSHLAISFNIHNWISDDDPPLFPDDCGVAGADIGGTTTDGQLFILESTGDPGDYVVWVENILAIALANDVDYCGPYFVSDDTPAILGGLNITKIEFFAEGISLFWQDFLGCEEEV